MIDTRKTSILGDADDVVVDEAEEADEEEDEFELVEKGRRRHKNGTIAARRGCASRGRSEIAEHDDDIMFEVRTTLLVHVLEDSTERKRTRAFMAFTEIDAAKARMSSDRTTEIDKHKLKLTTNHSFKTKSAWEWVFLACG